MNRHQNVQAETLEIRQLLTAVSMTDQEQLLLELVNRARLNPSAEAARYGIALNAGLSAGTITSDPKQPLAPEQSLTNAAGLHSLDMLNRDFFDHVNPDGLNAINRGRNAGYPTDLIGENIVYSGSTGTIDQNAMVSVVHEDLFNSPGHRRNMLHPPYEEGGMGVRYGVFTTGGTNYNSIMATENFGIRNVDPFITGVVFTDSDGNNFYSIGEAIRSGTVTATSSTGTTYTTDIGVSGGYGLIVPAGTYDVVCSFQRNGAWYRAAQTVNVSTVNVKADFQSGNAVVAGLTASLSTSALKETGSPATSILTVTRSGSTAGSLVVNLSSGDTTEATVPASITIAAGQVSAQATVTAVADGIIDGTQTVTINVSAAGYAATSRSLTVADTTAPSFSPTVVDTSLARPVIRWTGVSNAASYVLWVDNDSSGQRQFIYQEGLTSTSFTPAADMPVGVYKVWVRAVTSAGISSGWSTAQFLRVKTPPTVNGNYTTVSSSTVTVTWNQVPGATAWDVWVDRISASQQQYYRNTAVATNSVTLTGVEAGRYGFWVRPVNAAGFVGNWSARSHITVGLSPQNVQVTAAGFSDQPTISWDALPGASTYHIWVNNQTTGASGVVNQSNFAGLSYQLPALPAGGYAVWIRGIDGQGYGYAWSPVVQFDIQKGARFQTPSASTDDRRPLFSWSQVTGASRYELWVSSLDGAGRVIHEVNLTTRNFTPTADLAAGNYRCWVRAFDSANANTGWSGSYDFTISRLESPDSELIPVLVDRVFAELPVSAVPWSMSDVPGSVADAVVSGSKPIAAPARSIQEVTSSGELSGAETNGADANGLLISAAEKQEARPDHDVLRPANVDRGRKSESEA